MNRNAAATKAMNPSKRRAGNACWSSEGSFIENLDVVLQKVARSSVAEQQAVENHDDVSSSSSQSGSSFLRVVR